MKLDAEALEVESLGTTAASGSVPLTMVPETGTPTAATFCEFCASDSGCW